MGLVGASICCFYRRRHRQDLCLLTVLLAIILLAGQVMAQGGQALGDELAFSGRYQLNLHNVSVQGDEFQYVANNGYTPGTRWKQDLALSFFGPLYGGWNLQGKLDSTLLPHQRIEMSLRRMGNEFHIGTRQFSTGSAGLLDWARQITGVQGTMAFGPEENLRVKAVYGQPLGTPAHEVLPGRGITGPYLLNELHLPVVPESEVVRVDDIVQVRGADYRIDYEVGTLVFREPVLETSVITIEFEYESEKRRRTGLAMARWQDGPFTIDVMSGAEYALEEDNPLVFLPPVPEQGGVEDTWPLRQRMYGMEVAWQPNPKFNLVASWLDTMTDFELDGTPPQEAAAWQVGGGWHDDRGRAGFDYRLVPAGYRVMGRTADENNYQRLTAGYERQLSGPWYSKLNILLRNPLDKEYSAASVPRQKAEHVLTFLTDDGLVGWMLGLDSWKEPTGARKLYTSGLLLGKRVGVWDMQLEHRGVVARQGEIRPGEPLSLTKFSSSLIANERVDASVSWQRENQAASNGGPNAVSSLRLSAGSSTKRQGSSPTVNWQALWRQSKIHFGSGQQGVSPLRTTYGRVEGQVPLGLKDLLGSVRLETRTHIGVGQPQVERVIRADLDYNPAQGIGWSAFLKREDTSAFERGTGRGATVQIPLGEGWQYTTGLYRFSELSAAGENTSNQVTHGIAWSDSRWHLNGNWTAGLLEQPDFSGDDEERVGLGEVPLGKEVQFAVERSINNGRLAAGWEREWQADANVWRAHAAARWEIKSVSLEGRFEHSQTKYDEETEVSETGSLSIGWNVSEASSFSVQGQRDLSRSSLGLGDYNGTSAFASWSQYF